MTGQEFPRAYGTDPRTRHSANVFVVAVSALFASLTVFGLLPNHPHDVSIRGLFLSDFVVGSFLVFIGSGFNKTAILYEDAIEVVSWFRSRRLKFAEIRGRRTTHKQRGYVYVLMPLDGKRALVLPAYLHTDQVFRDWITTIPKVSR